MPHAPRIRERRRPRILANPRASPHRESPLGSPRGLSLSRRLHAPPPAPFDAPPRRPLDAPPDGRRLGPGSRSAASRRLRAAPALRGRGFGGGMLSGLASGDRRGGAFADFRRHTERPRPGMPLSRVPRSVPGSRGCRGLPRQRVGASPRAFYFAIFQLPSGWRQARP